MTNPDDPPTNPQLDAAFMSTAHNSRVYYQALVAEGFAPEQALYLVADYQRTIAGLAAMMPPIRPQDGQA